jgi:hypothetical protein
MANAGVTSTGLEEMRRAVREFPAEEQQALKDVARQTALREQTHARHLLRSQQKTEAHALADLIRVIDDSAHHQFKVFSEAPADQPDNVTIWNEHGTHFMSARPYMRPANDAERDRYRREMVAVSASVAEQTFR